MSTSKYLVLLLNAAFLILPCSFSWSQDKPAVAEDLQRSQFCAKAAKEFKNAPEWRAAVKLSLSVTFTSHFNKSMNKCLVQVVRVDPNPSGGVIVLSHVYDALEETILGGKVLVKKKALDNDKDANVLMVRDGKLLKDKKDVVEAYIWYETLMKD